MPKQCRLSLAIGELLAALVLAFMLAHPIASASTSPPTSPSSAAFADGAAYTSKAEEFRLLEAKRAISKQAYHFEQWPGKKGRVRPGVDVGRVLVARLPGIHYDGSAAYPEGNDYAPGNRSRVSWRAADTMVEVSVFASCDDAHEALINSLTFRINPAILAIGSQIGVSLGDVSFPGPQVTEFVRSNLMVKVEVLRSEAGDAIELSQLIDQTILARPTFDTYEQMAVYRPQIRQLRLKNPVTQPIGTGSRGSRVAYPLVVDVVDPEGGPIHLFWSGDEEVHAAQVPGSHTHEFRGGRGGPPADKARTEYLTLTAVSESGLFTTATLPIKVTDAGAIAAADERPGPK